MKYKNLVKRIGCKILFVLLAFMLGWLFGMAMNFFHGKDQMTETLSTAAEEGKKQIAITFDDGVIIGLSQEISYKEAVSMI